MLVGGPYKITEWQYAISIPIPNADVATIIFTSLSDLESCSIINFFFFQMESQSETFLFDFCYQAQNANNETH